MRARFFFATLADLEPNIRRAEEIFSVKYTPYFHGRAGTFPTTYNSALDIPDFGIVKEPGIATANESIWVTPTEYDVVLSYTESRKSCATDFEDNIYSILIHPGGWYKEKYFIAGWVGMGTDLHPSLQPFCDQYIRAITKGFKKFMYRSWGVFLGPEAISLYKQGVPFSIERGSIVTPPPICTLKER